MKGLSLLDSVALAVAPQWALRRARARAAARVVRNYEAAQPGRRTAGWARSRGDANVVARTALGELRMHARDLVRNNGWARKAQHVLANNMVSWGIRPLVEGGDARTAPAEALWKRWAESRMCEAEGRLTFYGIQSLIAKAVVTDGEVLIRKRMRHLSDGLAVPIQLQVLEADFLDSAKNADTSTAGGPIVQGVEFDVSGRRAAYWLFARHPGSAQGGGESRRVPAEDVLHVFPIERPGQARGVSPFGGAIVPLKDLDEYEDATLVRQKVAACFAAFVTDPEGDATALGAKTDEDGNPVEAHGPKPVEAFEPGMIVDLPPGKEITFASPPSVLDERFTSRNLRKVAAVFGVTYEDLTGDYSGVNFSSARLARIAHWANVEDYRENMLIPLLCAPVWEWVMGAAVDMGLLSKLPENTSVMWLAPPMPMIEPDKEGLAYSRLLRNGVMTHAQMVLERGGNPDKHWAEYARGLKTLDKLGIMLDSDPRKTSAAGLTQARTGVGDTATPDPADEAPETTDDKDNSDVSG